MPVTVLVFPAHAGMSRDSPSHDRRTGCFPRPRGDEPAAAPRKPRQADVFPAHAGMSQEVVIMATLRGKFSPPTRG